MNLFELPECQPDRLTLAWRRYEAACAALERADHAQDEYGDPVPSELVREHSSAQKELHAAQQARLNESRAERSK